MLVPQLETELYAVFGVECEALRARLRYRLFYFSFSNKLNLRPRQRAQLTPQFLTADKMHHFCHVWESKN